MATTLQTRIQTMSHPMLGRTIYFLDYREGSCWVNLTNGPNLNKIQRDRERLRRLYAEGAP